MKFKDSTIVILSKGNNKLVERLLRYLDEFCADENIIFADGDREDTHKKLIDSLNFKRLSYFHSYDADFERFCHKIRSSLDLVKTPYAMFCETDDFIIPEGIKDLEEFLNKNNEFISVGTSLPGFLIKKSKIKYYINFASEGSQSPSKSLISERFEGDGMNYVNYFHLYRTEKLKEIIDYLVTLNPRSGVALEQVIVAASLCLGRQYLKTNTIHYLRQYETSQGIGGGFGGFIDHLIKTDYISETNKITKIVSERYAKSTGFDIEESLTNYFSKFIKIRIRDTYIRKLLSRLGLGKINRNHLVRSYNFKSFLKVKRIKNPKLAEDLVNLNLFLSKNKLD